MNINFSLDQKGSKRVEIKSTGREKQRITIILGIDLLNNVQIDPFIVLKGKTTRCLKNIDIKQNCNISYQINSWCTEQTFIEFLSKFPKDKKILLLFDGFRAHTTEKVKNFLQNKYPLINFEVLPPNSTSILQLC